MTHKKKLIALALMIAAALFLAGCTPANPAPTAAPTVTEAPAAQDAPETLEEKAEEAVATAEAEVGKVIDQVQETGQAAAEELKETVEEARETVAEAADDLAQKADETAETVKAAIQGEEEKPVLLTLEELKEFTGKDGKPAYVAVDGVVYDVTASALWKDGSHNGFEAGQDLTEAIKEKAPHGVEKLENVKEIGRVKVELTLEELKEFNGKDGKPAYVAVDGVIYDVTASALWKDGSHNGFEAGQDLTEAIKEKSPHGVGKLENVVEIGVLKD